MSAPVLEPIPTPEPEISASDPLSEEPTETRSGSENCPLQDGSKPVCGVFAGPLLLLATWSPRFRGTFRRREEDLPLPSADPEVRASASPLQELVGHLRWGRFDNHFRVGGWIFLLVAVWIGMGWAGWQLWQHPGAWKALLFLGAALLVRRPVTHEVKKTWALDTPDGINQDVDHRLASYYPAPVIPALRRLGEAQEAAQERCFPRSLQEQGDALLRGLQAVHRLPELEPHATDLLEECALLLERFAHWVPVYFSLRQAAGEENPVPADQETWEEALAQARTSLQTTLTLWSHAETAPVNLSPLQQATQRMTESAQEWQEARGECESVLGV